MPARARPVLTRHIKRQPVDDSLLNSVMIKSFTALLDRVVPNGV